MCWWNVNSCKVFVFQCILITVLCWFLSFLFALLYSLFLSPFTYKWLCALSSPVGSTLNFIIKLNYKQNARNKTKQNHSGCVYISLSGTCKNSFQTEKQDAALCMNCFVLQMLDGTVWTGCWLVFDFTHELCYIGGMAHLYL